ncbi:hypothetical protein C8F04DRAFT_1183640 [Mycena alexandri]|uniref:Uncharacterized protein n=1 Tax=Mycena alexandri TaxID=1745969 RepID=A0AAD6X3U9_9AGAR|nr:hypothetical protein C8F04DRAFT_1183640 [Mycena alexandri]
MSPSSSWIPAEWEANAPHFDSKKPESLLQFLDHMKDLMANALVPRDKLKNTLVCYADYTAKQEWINLPSFKDGSYEEFVTDIVACHPSLLDIENGSLALWNKSLERFIPRAIAMDNQDKLFDLIGTLRAQVKYLVPGKLSDQEAAAGFLGKLDADFIYRTWNHLDMEGVLQSTLPLDLSDVSVASDHVEKRKGKEIEHYPFDVVVSAAVAISQGIVDRNDYNFKDRILDKGKVDERCFDLEMDAEQQYLDKKYQAAIAKLENMQMVMTEQFELHERQMKEFMMAMQPGSVPMQHISGSVDTGNTGLVRNGYNVGTDMVESLFPNGPGYDPRDDEILTLRVSEAKLKQQLALLSQPGTMVQPIPGESNEEVVQPASVDYTSQLIELMRAMVLRIEKTSELRSNPFRTGISRPEIEEEDFSETESGMDNLFNGSMSSNGQRKLRKRRPKRRTAHH